LTDFGTGTLILAILACEFVSTGEAPVVTAACRANANLSDLTLRVKLVNVIAS
jgi:hypothetical protein